MSKDKNINVNVKDEWNKQADQYNQFDDLSSGEVAEFANSVIDGLFELFDAHCKNICCGDCQTQTECHKLDDDRQRWEVIYNNAINN